jgi:hypothetical protein
MLDAIHYPRFITTNEKCNVMDKGHRCKEKASVELVFNGEDTSGIIGDVIVKFCEHHAKIYNPDDYDELIYESEHGK